MDAEAVNEAITNSLKKGIPAFTIQKYHIIIIEDLHAVLHTINLKYMLSSNNVISVDH